MIDICKVCTRRKACKENHWCVTFDRLRTWKNTLACDNFDVLHYGIWNDVMKEFQFGIDEPSKELAYKRLEQKIGHDAKKWRFEAKQLPKELIKYPVIKLTEEEFKAMIERRNENVNTRPVND